MHSGQQPVEKHWARYSGQMSHWPRGDAAVVAQTLMRYAAGRVG